MQGFVTLAPDHAVDRPFRRGTRSLVRSGSFLVRLITLLPHSITFLKRSARFLPRLFTFLTGPIREPVRVAGSSCAWSDDPCARPRTCARGRRLVRVFRAAVRASGHLCAHSCDWCGDPSICARIPATGASGRRVVRAAMRTVRAAGRSCAEKIAGARGRSLVRKVGTEPQFGRFFVRTAERMCGCVRPSCEGQAPLRDAPSPRGSGRVLKVPDTLLAYSVTFLPQEVRFPPVGCQIPQGAWQTTCGRGRELRQAGRGLPHSVRGFRATGRAFPLPLLPTLRRASLLRTVPQPDCPIIRRGSCSRWRFHMIPSKPSNSGRITLAAERVRVRQEALRALDHFIAALLPLEPRGSRTAPRRRLRSTHHCCEPAFTAGSTVLRR
jgi:hypothetical protein